LARARIRGRLLPALAGVDVDVDVDVAGLAASVLDETRPKEVRRPVRKVPEVVADAVAAALIPEWVAELRSRAGDGSYRVVADPAATAEEPAGRPPEPY